MDLLKVAGLTLVLSLLLIPFNMSPIGAQQRKVQIDANQQLAANGGYSRGYGRGYRSYGRGSYGRGSYGRGSYGRGGYGYRYYRPYGGYYNYTYPYRPYYRGYYRPYYRPYYRYYYPNYYNYYSSPSGNSLYYYNNY